LSKCPKAVIFDLDGTLVHSAIDFPRMKLEIIRQFKEAGVPENLLSNEMTVSSNMESARMYLLQKGQERALLEIEEEIERGLSSIEMEALPDVEEVKEAKSTLIWIKEKGLAIGVLTRGSRRYASKVLKKTSLESLIQCMICRDDFPWWEAKPNGLALKRLVQELGVDPSETLLVGDHCMDLECARSTGTKFVGVLTGSYDESGWIKEGLESIIDSIAFLPNYIERTCGP
jgi:phosphoglycolate phosphatase-like HAD superfamily hydrolase